MPFKAGRFTLASEILSIGEKAERIAEQAKLKQDEDGEFAKVFAETISEWLGRIAKDAEIGLAKVVELNTNKGLN